MRMWMVDPRIMCIMIDTIMNEEELFLIDK